jgi:hypothetical protein
LAALQAQLAPVSIVGTYDYFSFGIGLEVESFGAGKYSYNVTRNSYKGTVVFGADGTATFNATGGYDYLRIRDSISDVYQPIGGTGDSFLILNSGSDVYHPIGTDLKSLISGTFSHEYPTDSGTTSYTLNGSTITVVGGFVGTLSADGKIFVARTQSNATGIMIGIRRQ